MDRHDRLIGESLGEVVAQHLEWFGEQAIVVTRLAQRAVAALPHRVRFGGQPAQQLSDDFRNLSYDGFLPWVSIDLA